MKKRFITYQIAEQPAAPPLRPSPDVDLEKYISHRFDGEVLELHMTDFNGMNPPDWVEETV